MAIHYGSADGSRRAYQPFERADRHDIVDFDEDDDDDDEDEDEKEGD